MVAMEASSERAPLGAQAAGAGPGRAASSRAQLVEPYRSQGASGKNDANDAAAICEAACRPTMRFVPVKSRRTAEHAVRAPAARGLQGRPHRLHQPHPRPARRVRAGLPAGPSSAARRAEPTCSRTPSNEMNTLARLVLQRAQTQWHELDAHIAWCDERIAHTRRTTQGAVRPRTLMGIGPVAAIGSGHGGRLHAVQERCAVRRLVRHHAAPALQRRQERARAHHAPR